MKKDKFKIIKDKLYFFSIFVILSLQLSKTHNFLEKSIYSILFVESEFYLSVVMKISKTQLVLITK